MRPRRVIGYARVSSAAQAIGSSLQDQQDAIKRYAAAKGLEVTRMHVEAESSTRERIESRHEIAALLADVRKGDLILCYRLDRWSRDPEFTYRTIREVLQAGASFYAVDEQCDPSTPEGDTMLNFRVLFAREEHKRIRQRMIGTRQVLRDAGYYVEGVVPMGYLRPVGAKGVDKNILQIDEPKAAAVRDAFARCIRGQSLSQISDATGLTVDHLGKMLRKRIFCAEMPSADRSRIVQGKWPPIVSRDTFLLAQDALDSRSNQLRRRAKGGDIRTDGWMLRDVAVCAHCGSVMSAAYGQTRVYYMCRAKCVRAHVHVETVEMLFAPQVVDRLAELRSYLAKPAAKPKADDGPAKLADIAKRRGRIVSAFEIGAIDATELRGRLDRLDAERAKIDAATAANASVRSSSARAEALQSVDLIRRAWLLATPRERRDIVTRLATRVAIAVGVEPVATWVPVEALL